jgi:hypothetical protein
MERPPVFSLEVLADRSLVKDVVRGEPFFPDVTLFFPENKVTLFDVCRS